MITVVKMRVFPNRKVKLNLDMLRTQAIGTRIKIKITPITTLLIVRPKTYSIMLWKAAVIKLTKLSEKEN